MSQPDVVRDLLDAVASGKVSPAVAYEKVRGIVNSRQATPEQEQTQAQKQQYQTVGDFAKIDHDRADRTGFPEVIWGQDKTAEQIVQKIGRAHV